MSSKRRPWNEADIAQLRELYPDMRAIDVAARMDRAVSTVHAKASALGISKSDAFKASDLAGRVARGRQHPSMVATRFQPGLQPWNKGTHFVAGGRSAETRFKAGRAASEAPNYKPIGAYRINADGYLERQAPDDPSVFPARRWVGVHRLVWIEAHGSIPDGHAVVFRPGRRTIELELITPDALELVTRVELMKRNTVHARYPKEVAQLVQLKGAIKRQINRMEKEDR